MQHLKLNDFLDADADEQSGYLGVLACVRCAINIGMLVAAGLCVNSLLCYLYPASAQCAQALRERKDMKAPKATTTTTTTKLTKSPKATTTTTTTRQPKATKAPKAPKAAKCPKGSGGNCADG